MTEDILGYTTTDSPSFAHMKLGYYVVNASTEGTVLTRETAILVTSFVGSQILLRVKKQFANNQLQCVSLLSLSRAAMKKICL